nr:VP1 [Yellow-eyed penguin gyrovirus]
MVRRYRRPHRFRRRRRRWHPRRRKFFHRRHRFRHRRRRGHFVKYIKRTFFRPRPGFYTLKLPNPHNTLNLKFQGIIIVPVTCWPSTTPGTWFHRVATINLSLGNMLRAVMPLDYISKAGGPCAGSVNNPFNSNLPYWQTPAGKTTVASGPWDWWRWSLMLMHPDDQRRNTWLPWYLDIARMCFLLGGWHLFRHVKTTFKVLATRSWAQEWSPVASLLVQDSYFGWGTADNTWTDKNKYRDTDELQTPFPGGGYRTPNHLLPDDREVPQPAPNLKGPDELFPPSNPPGWNPTTYTQAKSEKGFYSLAHSPSFLTLSALGAPWSFPPHQQSVSKHSFNKHSISGNGDPRGKKWLTLLPIGNKNTEPTQQIPASSEVETVIAQLFLAQSASSNEPWSFLTQADYSGTSAGSMDPPWGDGSTCTHWAIIKVFSKWQLGNKQRPWQWDVLWGGSYRNKWACPTGRTRARASPDHPPLAPPRLKKKNQCALHNFISIYRQQLQFPFSNLNQDSYAISHFSAILYRGVYRGVRHLVQGAPLYTKAEVYRGVLRYPLWECLWFVTLANHHKHTHKAWPVHYISSYTTGRRKVCSRQEDRAQRKLKLDPPGQ